MRFEILDHQVLAERDRRRLQDPAALGAARIAFTGGLDFNDHRAIWDRLDKALAKHPGMVLLHAGVGLMMFSELWVGKTAVEAQMQQWGVTAWPSCVAAAG